LRHAPTMSRSRRIRTHPGPVNHASAPQERKSADTGQPHARRLHREKREGQRPQRESARARDGCAHITERNGACRPCHLLSHGGPKKSRPCRTRACRGGREPARVLGSGPTGPRVGPRAGRARGAPPRAAHPGHGPRRLSARDHRARPTTASRPTPPGRRTSTAGPLGDRAGAHCAAGALRGHGRAPRPCRGSARPSLRPE